MTSISGCISVHFLCIFVLHLTQIIMVGVLHKTRFEYATFRPRINNTQIQWLRKLAEVNCQQVGETNSFYMQ